MENDVLITHKFNILDDYQIIKDDRSQEAYFGKESPLSLILIKHVRDIKKLFPKDIKPSDCNSKQFIKTLKDKSTLFGIDMANELNMESVTFMVLPEFKDIAADSFSLAAFDNTEKINYKGDTSEVISLKKYVDIENIVCTNTGYKFKNKKNKLGMIRVSAYAFMTLETEVISAFICHEIGHMFQQGVFGTYKFYSDRLMMEDIKRIKYSIETDVSKLSFGSAMIINSSKLLKFIKLLFQYLWFPKTLKGGLFSKVGLFFYKTFGHRIIDEKTFMMKDKIRYDNADEEGTIEAKQLYSITKDFAIYTKLDRKETIKQYTDSNYDTFKDIKDPKKTKGKMSPFKLLKYNLMYTMAAISIDINNRDTNWLEFITLNDYTQKVYNDNVYYCKYEFFADIFASSYGFSKNLYKGLLTYAKDSNDYYNKVFDHGFYKCSLFNIPAKIEMYKMTRRKYLADEHGTTDQRITAIYTDLINELNTNEDLTQSQRKAITEQIAEIKEMDDQYYEDIKLTGGFFYKLYNKIIDHRITGVDKTIEDKILNPIKEICKE